VFVAINRLLARGAAVYWLRQPTGGRPAGDVWVFADAAASALIPALATELHLPMRALDVPPRGPALAVKPARIGLFQPWVASMDEGWTRYLLDRYEFAYRSLHNEDVKRGAIGDATVVVLPDVSAAVIRDGTSSERASVGPLPPFYAGGIGKEGAERLAAWVKAGGTLVALNAACDYAIELLELPVTNALAKTPSSEFSCPGSMLRMLFDTSHPLAFGMRDEEAGYFDGSPAFATRVPDGRFDRRVVARYPDDRRDILVSGYLLGEKLLERRAAVVEVTAGKGRVVLIGFKPQNRAQTVRTFKLLFNALLLPGLEEVTLP
jgi:hypothetical protein